MDDEPCAVCGRRGVPLCRFPVTFERAVPLCRDCFAEHAARRLTPLSVRLQVLARAREGRAPAE